MKEDDNTLSEWQAATLNSSALKYLNVLFLSWVFASFFIANEYGMYFPATVITIGCALYYWNERNNLGRDSLREYERRRNE